MMHHTLPPHPLTRAAVAAALSAPAPTFRVVLDVAKRPDAVVYRTDRGELVVRDDGPCHYRSPADDGPPRHDGPVERAVAEILRSMLVNHALPDGEPVPLRYIVDHLPDAEGRPVIVDTMPPAGADPRTSGGADVQARVARLNAEFERETDDRRPAGLSWRTDGRTWAWLAVDPPPAAPDVCFNTNEREFTAETDDGLFLTARSRRAIGEVRLPALGVEDYVLFVVERAPVGRFSDGARPLMATTRRPSVQLVGRFAQYVRAQLAEIDAAFSRGGA